MPAQNCRLTSPSRKPIRARKRTECTKIPLPEGSGISFLQEICYNDAKRNQDVKVNCKYCGKEFTIKGSTLHCRNRKDRHQSGYFCSRRCSGLYGKAVQLCLIKPSITDKIEASKYQVKSAQKETFDVEVG